MQTVVSSNEFFEIRVDVDINRLYIVCNGFWENQQVDEYLYFQTKALRLMKKSFTVLADMRRMKTLPKSLLEKQKQSQLELINNGMYKVAEIYPESSIAKLQLRSVTNDTNVPAKKFSNFKVGEAWLDEMSLKYKE